MSLFNNIEKPTIHQVIKTHGFIRIPCVYDGISAKIAEQSGFPAVAFSGNAVSASLLGMPDLGVLGMSENIEHVSKISRNLKVPVICDADTGYGGVMNVIRTVRDFEASGISGIHIEDQVTPKRCGLLPQGIPVISQDEQIIKIKAAIEARSSKDFYIIARTDAKSMHGLEEACRRAKAYVHAGADAAIVMGANTPDELRYASQVIQAPLVTVIQETPPTTLLTDELLREVGCVIALHAGVARYAAVKALQTALKTLSETGSTASVSSMMSSFEEYNSVLGLDQWLNIENHFLG